MKRGIAFSMSALGALAGAALAQDEPARQDGVYARAGAGATFLDDWEQDYLFNPDLVFIAPPPTGQTVENAEGFLAAFALGFDYADGIRTELEYRYATTSIDAVTVNEAAGPTAVTTANDDINAHFLMSNFYFDFYNNSRLTPFIGAGVGGAFVENEAAMRDAALAWQGRAGVSVELGGGFSTDLEYIFLRTNELAYGPDPEDFAPDGPFETAVGGDRYQSSSVMMSLRKHF